MIKAQGVINKFPILSDKYLIKIETLDIKDNHVTCFNLNINKMKKKHELEYYNNEIMTLKKKRKFILKLKEIKHNLVN